MSGVIECNVTVRMPDGDEIEYSHLRAARVIEAVAARNDMQAVAPVEYCGTAMGFHTFSGKFETAV